MYRASREASTKLIPYIFYFFLCWDSPKNSSHSFLHSRANPLHYILEEIKLLPFISSLPSKSPPLYIGVNSLYAQCSALTSLYPLNFGFDPLHVLSVNWSFICFEKVYFALMYRRSIEIKHSFLFTKTSICSITLW